MRRPGGQAYAAVDSTLVHVKDVNIVRRRTVSVRYIKHDGQACQNDQGHEVDNRVHTSGITGVGGQLVANMVIEVPRRLQAAVDLRGIAREESDDCVYLS